jgi:hypothetical protein
VITAYGLTDAFHPKAGLPQGGMECPIHYLIFQDPLLTMIQENIVGAKMKIPNSITPESNTNEDFISVPVISFVDDTTVLAKNYEEATEITNIITQFNKIHGIKVNPKRPN